MNSVGEESKTAAMPLTGHSEPLARSETEHEAQTAEIPLSRQARRKARRDAAKARKRRGKLVTADAVAAGRPPEVDDQATRLKDEVSDGGSDQAEGELDPAPPPASDDYLIVAERDVASKAPTSVELARTGISMIDKDTEPVVEATPQLDMSQLGAILAGATETRSDEHISFGETPDAPDPYGPLPETLNRATETPPWQGTAQEDAPIPRNRALSDPNEKLLPKLRRWVKSLLDSKKSSRAVAQGQPSLDHLLDLRSDLASVQRRIDQLIDAAKG